MAEQKKNIKIWTATRDSRAGVMVTENEACMVAEGNNYVSVSKNGIALSGKGISFQTVSENQTHGGVFIKMNDIVQMIPTTLVTPMPAQVPFPPLAFASEIVEDMPTFMGFASSTPI